MAPLASRSLLLDGVSVAGRMVAVGERGHILVAENPSQRWRQLKVPTQATLTGVFFHDKNRGWVVGHDAIILRTRDGGEHWEPVYDAPEDERPLLDVWFRDAENGFAIGAYGLFLVTSDGGTTWSERPLSEDDFHLNHIARSATGRLYIAAEAGTLYRSDDEGETWISLPSPYAGSFFGTLPLEGDTLLLFGLRGHLFRSEDAGKTWVRIETGTEAMLTDGLRLDDGTLIVGGLAGTVLISHDDGQSFSLRQQSDRKGLTAVLQGDDGPVIQVGEVGVKPLPPSVYARGARSGFSAGSP